MKFYYQLRRTFGKKVAEAIVNNITEAMQISDVYIADRNGDDAGLAFKINGKPYRFATTKMPIDDLYNKFTKLLTFSHYKAYSWLFNIAVCYYGDKDSRLRLAKEILDTHPECTISENDLYKYLTDNSLNDMSEFEEFTSKNKPDFMETEGETIEESVEDLVDLIAKDLKLYLNIPTDEGYRNAAEELIEEFELDDMDDYYQVSLKDIKKFLCL